MNVEGGAIALGKKCYPSHQPSTGVLVVGQCFGVYDAVATCVLTVFLLAVVSPLESAMAMFAQSNAMLERLLCHSGSLP